MNIALLKRAYMVSLYMLLTICNTGSKRLSSPFTFKHPAVKKLTRSLSYELVLKLPFAENDLTFPRRPRNLIIIEHPTRKIDLNARKLTIDLKTSRLYRYPYEDCYNLRNYSYLNDTETLILNFKSDISS